MKCVECCKYMTDGCAYGGESPTGRACVDGIRQEVEVVMEQIKRDRDKAFTEAVLHERWDLVRKYAKKYGVPIPKDKRVMKAGVYKAVQYCEDIPEEVKVEAFWKCLELGMVPMITFGEEEECTDN